jgi:hypothetical protein
LCPLRFSVQVDLAMLLASPDRVIQISANKRQRTDAGSSSTAWPIPEASAAAATTTSAVDPAAALRQVAADAKAASSKAAASKAAAKPPLQRQESRSHLKRPAGLALHDLVVPAIPSGVGPQGPPVGDADGPLGGLAGEIIGEIGDELDVPLIDVASALSPLLASTFGLAPQSMRSFLRIDDLTFDLLSPLGAGRPAEGTSASETAS